MNPTAFRLAQRTSRLTPSMIRELMKLMGRPGLVSLGGGLPSAVRMHFDGRAAGSG